MFEKSLILVFTVFFSNFLDVQAVFTLRRPVLLDPPENVTTVNTKTTASLYFDQRVDHFNPTETRTFQQRYHINEDYYNETIKNHFFLMLGGEWEATERWMNYGAWLDTAKTYGALLIYLEHRYYGMSQPFSDLGTENLQYLSSNQALEDAASFIQGINAANNLTASEAKWIVFGGSYAGSLAAWLRQKYPNLVTGAMSSSAPLEAILDFNEYLQIVRNGLETHSTICVDNIKNAYAILDEMTTSCLEDTLVYENLNDVFTLCETIGASEGNSKDLSTLFQSLSDNLFAYVVQYNGMIDITIDDVCKIMVGNSSDNLQKLANVNTMLLNYFRENCTDHKYENLVADLQNTTIDDSTMMRQWMYQSCTEFGFFQTSTQTDPIFSSNFDKTFFTDLCIDVFGGNFNSTLTSLGITTTNNRYGSRTISTSNIVYFHGDIDPWHVLGKVENGDGSNDVIIVEGASHCANMRSPKSTDSSNLTAARNEIDKQIGQWLKSTSTDSISNGSTSPADTNANYNSAACLGQTTIIFIGLMTVIAHMI